MAKTFPVTWLTRLENWFVKLLTRLGLIPKRIHLLTVKGRKTGEPYTIPVSVVDDGGNRWLVSPYGEVSWVKNARAAGQVTLSRAGRLETVTITEMGPEKSAPILKKYVGKEWIVRPYFDVRHLAPIEAFVAEASKHPVFRIKPLEE